MTPNELLQTESSDTSKTVLISQPNLTRQDSLPRGSELALKTIKRLASEAEKTDSYESILEKVKAINREVTELIARCEKRAAAIKTEAA